MQAAYAAGSAAGAFNAITLEHAEAVVLGAERAGLPVILALSHNAVRFHGGNIRPLAAAAAQLARDAAVPVGLHLDHAEDLTLLRDARTAGIDSVMFDAGALPHGQNTAATEQAARWAHENGVWIEAELGYVGGKAGAPASAHAPGVRTDPDEAREYVQVTGVDALAVAVGTSHAMTTRTATLDLALIERLRAAVPVPLVLHGSSGVPDDQLRAAVQAGIAKVNVGTALNLAYTEAVRAGAPEHTDPRRYLRPAREAMAETVARLLTVVSGPG